jgi:hypothetical protein
MTWHAGLEEKDAPCMLLTLIEHERSTGNKAKEEKR